MPRIEVYEKYLVNPIDEDERDRLINLRMDLPEENWSYRRTMPLVKMIDRPIEIKGNKKELVLLFWSGEQMTIKGDYDEFCNMLHDIEEEMDVDNLMNED